MSDREVTGILCKKDRTFYYLETGHHSPRNVVDRLRGLLINRGLISYHREDPSDRSAPYLIMSLAEAKDKGVDVEVVYLNKHIEKTVKSQVEKKQSNPWLR